MRIITEYDTHTAYVLANNSSAKTFLEKNLDSFIESQNENVIFIIYNVINDVTLLHCRRIEPGTSFEEAIQLVKNDILNGDLCADDENLQKVLNDPQATTAKFLLEFIDSEE